MKEKEGIGTRKLARKCKVSKKILKGISKGEVDLSKVSMDFLLKIAFQFGMIPEVCFVKPSLLSTVPTWKAKTPVVSEVVDEKFHSDFLQVRTQGL